MTFAKVLVQVRELRQSKGRVSYRTLKLQFNLDDDYLEGLKDGLIEVEHVAEEDVRRGDRGVTVKRLAAILREAWR